MYATTGLTDDEITNLCALIYANEENCDIDPWPPSLGLYKSVVIALTYMRRNRIQQELAETYKTSQPTISRANSRIRNFPAGDRSRRIRPHGGGPRPGHPVHLRRHAASLLVVARAPGTVLRQAQNHR